MRSMTITGIVLSTVAVLSAPATEAQPVDSAFTYQGQLKVDGVPANGLHDFRFTLHDRAGTQIGLAENIGAEPVTNGLFNVVLNFGADAFNGEERYLDIQVRSTGSGMPFDVLSPRQEVMPLPYATTALKTVGVDGHSLDASDGDPVDALFVASNGKVHVGHTGLDVYDELGHGVTFTTDRITFDEFPSENTVYDYRSSNQTHRFFTDGTSRLEIAANGNVGIGLSQPHSKLDVAGTVAMTGFRLGGSTTSGYVLTTDSSGVGAWRAPPAGGDSFWEQAPGGIYYPGGNIGFGLVTNPSAPLQGVGDGSSSVIHVRNTFAGPGGNAITAEADAFASNAVFGRNNATTSTSHGVYGFANSPDGDGVRGRNQATAGNAVGVRGMSNSTEGTAVYGHALADTGTTYGVHGEVDSPDGFAGYFEGKGFFSGNVGIGVTNPFEKLDVAGTVKMTGLKLGSEATTGHVLTTDGSGVGSWQAAPASSPIWTQTGSEIVFDGHVGIEVADPLTALHVAGGNDVAPGPGDFYIGDTSTFGMKFGVLLSGPDAGACKIMTSGIGSRLALGSNGADETITLKHSKVGILNDDPQSTLDVNGVIQTTGFKMSNGSTAGHVFTCDGTGNASWQTPTGGGTFDLPYDGSISSSATAFKVTNTGTGMGAHAVSGVITNPATSSDASAGIFLATGTGGKAIYAQSGSGSALDARNDSGGTTIQVKNSGVGNLIEGRRASGGPVFKVTNDGTTHTNVLQINGGSDLSEQFDIEAAGEVKPGMVACIDPVNPGKLLVSTNAYDRTVAGIVSGAGGVQPGMLMGQNGSLADGQYPVALTGRVYVRAVTSNGAIQPGDLLTTSGVAGHAMKVTDHTKAQGAIIGKAMTSLPDGDGLVLVLVSLQ